MTIEEMEEQMLDAQGEVHYRATRFEWYGGWHNEQLFKAAVARLEKVEKLISQKPEGLRVN